MKTTIILLAASAAIGLTASAAPDDAEPTGILTLRDALGLTLQRNPALSAAHIDLRIADARILQAKLWPNPEAEATSENIVGSREYAGAALSENTLLLGQLIELGGKRRARIGEANSGRELAGFDYETKKREVFRETAEHFIDVLAGQRRVALTEELVRLAETFVPAVEKRVEAGKASELEKTRLNVAIASARIDLEQARGELAGARQRLAACWGSTRPRFRSVAGDLEATPDTASLDALARRLPANPRLARFGAETAQREAALAREKAAAIPDVTVRAGARQLNETNDVTAVIGLSVPLPFWNRNQGNIRAARAQLERADAERAVVATALMTELSDAYQRLVRARSAIAILRDDVLPGADVALSATSEGYEAGRFSYLEVLDARRTIGAARIQYLEACADYHKARHAIEALTAGSNSRHLP